MNDIHNPLAGHPLLRRDVEAKPVIAEAMADAMAAQPPPALVGADFGVVEARAIAAHKAGMLDDHGVPYGMNRGGDAFPKDAKFAGDPRQAPPIRAAMKAVAVGLPDPSAADLAAAQAEIEKVSKPSVFVVPASMTDKEIDEITKKIAEKTKLPFEVVRGKAQDIVRQQATFAAQSARDHMASQKDRLAMQITKALGIIEHAGRPVKMGFIEHELGESIFRALEPELRRHPNVASKMHKNQLYLTWKA